jgi:hypothetical protein
VVAFDAPHAHAEEEHAMRRSRIVESRRDRMELATDAGYPKVSLGSVLAGVLVAYGAFAVIAAIAGGILTAMGVDMDQLSSNDWREYGMASAAVGAFCLFLSYLFGGYVAGRMARRAGALNGALVFLFGILLVAGVAAAVGTQAGSDTVMDNLRSMGVPTSGEEYAALGTFAGIAAVVAMLLGSILGGIQGERWHGKLLARAMDPSVGPEPVVVDEDGDRTTEVRSSGRHFATDDDRRTDDVVETDADTDTDTDRTVDVTDRSTTLDDDLAPEHTRTLH